MICNESARNVVVVVVVVVVLVLVLPFCFSGLLMRMSVSFPPFLQWGSVDKYGKMKTPGPTLLLSLSEANIFRYNTHVYVLGY